MASAISGSLNTFSEATGKFVAKSETLQIAVGGKPMLLSSGHSIRLVKIIEDTRCPLDLLCVSAGFVRFEVEIKAEKARTHILSLAGLSRLTQVSEDNSVILESLAKDKTQLQSIPRLFFYSLDPYPGFVPPASNRYPNTGTVSFMLIE